MNQRQAKKLNKAARRYARKSGQEYVKHLMSWPFLNRLNFCWHIMVKR